MGSNEAEQDGLFAEAMQSHGAALARMARGYEADAEQRRDLEQELQVALWQSLADFDGRCALGTWVWRVAHNRAISHVLSAQRHGRQQWTSIDDVDLPDHAPSPLDCAESDQALALLLSVINKLDPPDRQILLLYLEGETGADIAAITGVSADVAAAKIHRFKAKLAERYAPKGDVL